ncbi:AroM family protein [Streptomyces endophyticus]|uniref:AroM family protein n=1 Tax=Streptomyces endophyticus TaxID=714166 RepID=A0ABU6FIB0_9ACTN|nr:AroM family protein [Streptomyces endophyticus]MEB8343793.1 AroM family protein [Streptomyces endophyticus]
MPAASDARGVLGLVTIGQAPRTDLTPDILPITAGLRLTEHGALDHDRFDGPDADAVRAAVGPVPGEAPLISRLRDGGSAVLGHDALAPRMADAVARCEADGADATLLLCTGHFPPVPARGPLLYAEPLVQHGVRALVGADPVGVVCPLPAQREDVAARWARLLPGRVTAAPADPYGGGAPEQCAAAARELAAGGARWIVLDCIGYTEEMRHAAAAAASVPVLLARTLAVRLAAEAAQSAAQARG